MGVQGGIHFHTFSVLVYRAMLREMIFDKNHCINIGYTGSIGQKGEPGLIGIPGSNGSPGIMGRKGEPGTQGMPGAKGEMGQRVSWEQIVVTMNN